MKHLVWIIFLSSLSLVSGSAASLAHEVGEPLLEQVPIWKACCSDHDCIPQRVKILGKGSNKVSVEIEGTETKVEAGKFSPVPSPRTWVCYVNPNREVSNENIRCILFPEKGGMANASIPQNL
jgi:hypothetical protein